MRTAMVAPLPFAGPAAAVPAGAKQHMRRLMRAARRAAGAAERERWSEAACGHAAAFVATVGPGPVAAFISLDDEIDTAALIRRLRAAGRQVLLPRQVGRGQPLSFHLHTDGGPLEAGPFGVREPPAAAPTLHPAAVVVPLLAFDAAGGRLGYGAGFYDRTLEALDRAGPRPPALGLAFALQQVPAVPMAAHDRCLDGVATERGLVGCRRLPDGG